MNTKIIFALVVTIIIGLPLQNQAQQSDWQTLYEQSNFLETPNYEQTIEFCMRLASHSPLVHFTSFGVSPQGRDLPLLIIDKDQRFEPQDKDEKLILLIEAGIHPGEPDGKDAGFLLIRDMIIHGKHLELLDNITILFIPIFNVDGYDRFGPYNRINQNGPKEMGWRTNAQNLNLNRDFIKADALEMKAWLKLFSEWLPHFFIDCHTTNGADYQYALTYMLETHGNMDKGLTLWQTNVYEPEVSKKMEASGFPIFRYVQFRQWHDPRSGLRSGAAPGMLSQGYTALLNRPGLLVETHMLKDYKTRVNATYEMIIHTMQILKYEGQTLIDLIDKADLFAASAEFRQEPFPLGFTISQIDSVMVDFLGVEYNIETSPLTGGPWFQYYPDQAVTFTLPLFDNNVPSATAMLPEAFIIPAEWQEVIERVQVHGIEMQRIDKPVKMVVETYRFENPNFRNAPNEGRHMVNAEGILFSEERTFHPGSVIVSMNQPKARLIARMLEPGSSDSFLQWGFFNAIFEQKEYGETYVMEPLAQQMLLEDESLRIEFEEMKANNPELFSSQWAMLNWFYTKTPWWDQKKNVYPVGRITKQ
ncbi:MAG: M14 family metallopeptidase [Bacteroidales bacterium]|nr:M14 family metallopeptidase [Bacteroidales bacterium]